MELMPGYKQTEVGVIPEEWDVKKLSELGAVVRGGSPRPAGDPRYFKGDFIPWLTVAALTNIPDYQLVVSETVGFLTETGSKLSRILNNGTLIIANSGATLGVAKILGVTCCANDGIAAIINQRAGIKAFVCFYINTQTNNLREVVATGNGQPNLNTDLIREITIPFPPEPEQQAIATALSDVNALLDGLDRLIVKKRDLKQAAMQQLLTGKTRLPGFTGEWEEKRLGELGIFLKGRGVKKDDSQSGSIPCVRYGELYTHHNEYIKNYYSFISPEVASTAQAVKQGDILFAGSGETREEIGKCAAFVGDCEAYAGGDVVIFRSQGLDPLFLGFSLNMPSVNRQKASKGQGDAIVHISAAALSSIVVTLPPEIDEQTAIATVLSDMDAEILVLEQRRAKTKNLKQAMMQELLTGRIRLIKPCESVAQEFSKSTDAKPHSWAFNEAVVISTLAKHFGKEDFPLGRKRYTKLSYLLHRHAERQAEGYLKKAAGPYNPKTKYGGPERIALENGYIREHKNGRYSGFVAADNIAPAEEYFEKWYGPDAVRWLNQFRFKTNDDLEVLATVDMAAEELRTSGKVVDVTSVKEVIRSHPEWKAKLNRAAFSDTNIANGIKQNHILFNSDNAGGSDA